MRPFDLSTAAIFVVIVGPVIVHVAAVLVVTRSAVTFDHFDSSRLIERGMLFRRLFVLRHHCCSSAATSRRHCLSHRTLHYSVRLGDSL